MAEINPESSQETPEVKPEVQPEPVQESAPETGQETGPAPEPAPEPKPEPEPAPPLEPPHPDRPKAPEIKNPSRFRRAMYAVFGTETRFGRFFRAFLRVLAAVVGLFALGVLAAYLLLYRPAEKELQSMRAQATQSANQLDLAQQNLARARQDAQNADTRAEDAQNQLSTELTRVQVLRAMNAVTDAEVAIAQKDKAAALKSLTLAEDTIKQAQPRLDKLDPQEASTLQALFTLAKNDLDRDLTLASQDLARLQTELARVDHSIQ